MPRPSQQSQEQVGIPVEISDRIIAELHTLGMPEKLRTPLEQRAQRAAALDWLRNQTPGQIRLAPGGVAYIGDKTLEQYLAEIGKLTKPADSPLIAAMPDVDWAATLTAYREQLTNLIEQLRLERYTPAKDWLRATYRVEKRGAGEEGKKKSATFTIGGLPLEQFRKLKKPTTQDGAPDQVTTLDEADWQVVLTEYIDDVTGVTEQRNLQKTAYEWLDDTFGYRVRLEGHKVIITGFDSKEFRKRDKPSREEAPTLADLGDSYWKKALEQWVTAAEIKARKEWREPSEFEVKVYLDATYEEQITKRDGQIMVNDMAVAEFLEMGAPPELEGLDREKWKQYKTSWLASTEKRKWPASPTMEQMYNQPPAQPAPQSPEQIEQQWRDRPPVQAVIAHYEQARARSTEPARRPNEEIEEYLRRLDTWKDAKASLREAAGFALGVLSMVADKSVEGTLGRLTRSGKLKTEAGLMADILQDILFERGMARRRRETDTDQHRIDIQLRLSALNARIHGLTQLGLPKKQMAPLYEHLVKMVDARTELEIGFEQELIGVLRDFFARKSKERKEAV